MLLYTRLAAPKQPKRRSRGGCAYCKEKKKKCDEQRPNCSRCVEHGVECAYEAVKPRQRRRRESAPLAGGASGLHSLSRRFSQVSHFSHDDYLGSFYQPSLDDRLILSPCDSTFDAFSLAPFSPTEFMDGHGDDVGSDDGQAGTSTAVVHQSRSHYPDLAMIAPSPVGSPLLDFCAPTFSEFSDRPNRRALVDHFCNVLSHLIVFREETGNPFQQMVLPLTRGNSPVTYAMYALASAHLEYRGVENPEKSLFFHNMAIRGVAQLIEHSSKANRNETLAAIMLLVYYECLVQKGHSNIVAGHLKGALTIMGAASDPADSTSVFLERAFSFYDVITALSNGTPPLSAAPTPGCLLPLSPLGAPPLSPLCNVDTLLGMSTTLWPIIHRLAGLRALKTELEAAVGTGAAPSKIAVLRTEFESTAQAIESALIQWQPQLPPGFIPDDIESHILAAQYATDPHAPIPEETEPDLHSSQQQQPPPTSSPTPTPTPIPTATTTTTTTAPPPTSHPAPPSPKPPPSPSSAAAASPYRDHGRIASIHHNALAYRHASLVYLYRTVLGQPRVSPAVQGHARLALAHCVATVRHRGPMSALLWPLFVAACEAVSRQDRGLAERAFAEVERRQGMRNIERAWGIVREVWKRRGGNGKGRRGVGGKGGSVGGGGGEVRPPREELMRPGKVGEGVVVVTVEEQEMEERGGGVVVEEVEGEDGEGQDVEDEGVVNVGGVVLGGEEIWRRVCREMGVSIVFG